MMKNRPQFSLVVLFCIILYTLYYFLYIALLFFHISWLEKPKRPIPWFWREHFNWVVRSLCMRASLLLLQATYNVDNAVGSNRNHSSAILAAVTTLTLEFWVFILFPVWLVRRKKLFWSKNLSIAFWNWTSCFENIITPIIYTKYAFWSCISRYLLHCSTFIISPSSFKCVFKVLPSGATDNIN